MIKSMFPKTIRSSNVECGLMGDTQKSEETLQNFLIFRRWPSRVNIARLPLVTD